MNRKRHISRRRCEDAGRRRRLHAKERGLEQSLLLSSEGDQPSDLDLGLPAPRTASQQSSGVSGALVRRLVRATPITLDRHPQARGLGRAR